MRLSEIISIIEELAPLDGAAPWDASGLQVAAQRDHFEALAVCLDPSVTSISEALERGADCILTHHPLSLKPTLPNRLDAYHEVLRKLFLADVPLYAAHTSLDVNPYGPMRWLAAELGLENVAVLEPTAPPTAQTETSLPRGFGLVGDLPSSLDLTHLAAMLREHVDLATATFCGPVPRKICRIAYCTGSGASLLWRAKEAGAQLFITGDVKYHAALEAALGVLDVGHHSLEEEMMRRMSEILAARLETLRVMFVPSASPFHPVPTT